MRFAFRKRKKAESPKGGGGVDVGRELEKVQAKIEAAKSARDSSGLVEKDALTRGEERKLAELKNDIEKLDFKEANLYRLLEGKPLVPLQVSKSFREADPEHIAKATGIDLRSRHGDLGKQRWTDLPDGDFPEDRLDRLVSEWADVSNITFFAKESCHRLLIDLVLKTVVLPFDGEIVFTCEHSVEHAQKDDDSHTTYILRGDIDYTLIHDERRVLAAGRSSSLPPRLKPMNFVAVEAKRDLLEITKAEMQLVAETCALRKERTDTDRSGLIYGVLSNAKEWLFIMIDEEAKLHVSDIITVKLGTPDRDAFHQVCRVIYGMLAAGLEYERDFRPPQQSP